MSAADNSFPQLPGYTILRRLGEGGMATVYLAIQNKLDREVAIKVMADHVARNPEFSERFLREAKIVGSLVHPNIVTVYDVDVVDGLHYLSMECVPGEELKRRVGELGINAIVRVITEVARALDFAASKGFVHRDIKPENILLHAEDRRAVLTDFGIARAVGGVSDLTQTGQALGTPHYMSPEQARGKPVDVRSDLYSLGVVFYLLLTHRMPFDGDTSVAVALRHISEPPPPLPEGLEILAPIIDRLLAKKPEQRFASGAELVAALEAIPRAQLLAIEHLVLRRSTTPLPPLPPFGDDRAETRIETTEAAPTRLHAAMQVPEEDLAERRSRHGGGGNWLWLLVPMLVAAAGAAVWQYRAVWQAQLSSADSPSPALAEVTTAPGAVNQAQGPAPAAASAAEQPAAAPAPIADPVTTWRAELDALLAAPATGEDALAWRRRVVGLQRRILAAAPDDATVRAGLQAQAQQLLAPAQAALEARDFAQGQAALAQYLGVFPEHSDTDAVRALDMALAEGRQQAQKVAALLADGNAQLARGALGAPEGDNALASFRAALALDPDSAAAQAGIAAVAARYGVLAQRALQAGELARASALLDRGLTLRPGDGELLAIQRALAERRARSARIAELLAQGQRLEAQGQAFGAISAAASYSAMLGLDASHSEAQRGLDRLKDSLVIQVRTLLREGDFGTASALLAPALEQFPEEAAYTQLAEEIATSRPYVDTLRLLGESLADGAVRAARVLNFEFAFRNFDPATTVLQAIVYDSGRRQQIAAVPVVVTGRNGRQQFRIERPLEGFSAGSYRLELQAAGRPLAQMEFTVAGP
ncbi:MAG TPA: protein kinase [Spongiibacteraceae bacterium]|nr:protein kinase [Spongiibacteraceae bacterium]